MQTKISSLPTNLDNSYKKIKTFRLNEDNTSYVTEFVNKLIQNAITNRASDIHLEPLQTGMRVRARIDGILHELCHPSHHVAPAILSHIKIRAQMNITEKRLPQDGRFRILSNKKDNYVCRVSSLPTIHGEKIVLRLLPSNNLNLSISKLGLNKEQKALFTKALNRPQGLILITGPTGCGKTTTLYTALNQLNTHDMNITSIENPVEIEIPRINQLNVDEKIGLSFQTALKALLRQDPDVIMVGEIRDANTASLAIQAAQTGHLVLSTLHTNNTIDTLSRLSLMGISSLNLAESLELIIAQRLLRTLCKHCKHNPHSKCRHCKNGYYGRTGVFELLPINAKMRDMIRQKRPVADILACTRITSLHQAALEKAQAGITNSAEISRIIK